MKLLKEVKVLIFMCFEMRLLIIIGLSCWTFKWELSSNVHHVSYYHSSKLLCFWFSGYLT